MSIRAALNIYGRPWLIEPNAALQLLDHWEAVRSTSENWNFTEVKSALRGVTYEQKFFESKNVVLAPTTTYELNDFKGFEGSTMAVIPIQGPLMKEDFCGTLGTKSLMSLFKAAAATESVKCIVFLHDSPGGSASGNDAFATLIRNCDKRTVSIVEGYMCSADYWIGCACDEMYASSNTDMIGSIGTMCAFYDNTKYQESQGRVLREFYATDSTEKNRDFREAKKGDGKLLVEQTLDPLNNVFIQAVKTSRGDKLSGEEGVLNGKVYTTQDAIKHGLIDGMKTLDQLITEVEQGYTIPKTTTTIITKNKHKAMSENTVLTKETFKQEHPALFQEITADAAKVATEKEQERVKTWLVYKDVDAEACLKGIETGAEVTSSIMAEMTLKAGSKKAISEMKEDNPKTVATAATTDNGAPSAEEVNKNDFLAACRRSMGLPEKK